MPINYARRLTGPQRSAQANRHLGYALAFIAGASNAGGFLAVHQYTSHMTGIVATAADSLALNDYLPVLAASGALLSFITGAAVTAIMVNYARRHRMASEYALPLLLEAILLLCFGILGARLAGIHGLFVPLTVMLLCFIMGLQNAVMTKLSGAEIRTTHLTGTVTDIGIELGKLFYWNANPSQDKIRVVANRARLRQLVLLASSFFIGGVAGAMGFKHAGYLSTVPLALLLCVLAIVPAMDDVLGFMRRPAGK
ncbi:YoaK family protein [Noviherbaspirillum malthae]|jgi:uncharacterized membrane protein YoaK (UPF0700 family)|uniref:YoaK family protein n=1 Tax=Noviherbaspirillum malthae TaxID=1260987 RepID=UPI00188F48AC|nr:YoaK family protein [Noviherbaspirillum malthae]